MKQTTKLLTVLIILFSSCMSEYEKDIAFALSIAENNKEEIQKVLNYYKGDSLKYKAAIFLLKNVPYHYCYKGWQIDSLKYLKEQSITDGRIQDDVIAQWKEFDYLKLPKEYDIITISSELLIDNIEYAFKAWNKYPWSKSYTFDDFCKYVLPYRIWDEPLENWRKTYYDRYSHILDSLYHGDDAVEAARVMANFLKSEGFTNRTDFDLPHLGALFLYQNRVGYCRENCDISVYVMRSVGIPVAVDFYEISPSYNSRHFWNAVIDTNHLAVPFNYTEKEISRDRIDHRRKGKVYRLCFDKQKEKVTGQYENEGVCSFFKQFLYKDVSDEYFPNSHIFISGFPQTEQPYMYLSVFSGKTYVPIDIAKSNSGAFHFMNIEDKIVYFPTTYTNGKMECTTYPFYLINNKPIFLNPDTSHTESICLKRKYPLLEGRDFIKSIRGVKIEGSSTSDFRSPTLLYEFRSDPRTNYNRFLFEGRNRIRYIRYSSPKNNKIQLAEFYIYEKSNKTPLIPQCISSSDSLDNIHRKNLVLFSDGIWDSFYMSAKEGEKLTFDFGRLFNLKQMVVIPRNDDNYIRQGDTYELYCHYGKRGWQLIGRKKAETDSVIFSGVPSNSLLWLHNPYRGNEERPFFMEKGKQVFP